MFDKGIIQGIYGPALEAELDRKIAWLKRWQESPKDRERAIDARDRRLIFWADQLALHEDNAILELHHRGDYGCEGCDFAGWEGEPPDWPCRTVRLIIGGYPDYDPDLRGQPYVR